ncbi:2Fe-2S iron-sulfur cluster binding domain-containing protein [Cryomyces antarcticus]
MSLSTSTAQRIASPALRASRSHRSISTTSCLKLHREPYSNCSALSAHAATWKSRAPTQAAPSFPRARRRFSSTPKVLHGHLTPPKPGEERNITIIDKEGASHTFQVADGDNILDIAQAHDLEMEGACGGSCACSTCHVIVDDPDMYDKMEEPDDDENDMLDLAFGLTETSRLGCQVKMSKALDGLAVKLPSMTRNMQASDFAAGKKD